MKTIPSNCSETHNVFVQMFVNHCFWDKDEIRNNLTSVQYQCDHKCHMGQWAMYNVRTNAIPISMHSNVFSGLIFLWKTKSKWECFPIRARALMFCGGAVFQIHKKIKNIWWQKLKKKKKITLECFTIRARALMFCGRAV